MPQKLVIEMNLGAPRAGFARGAFDFGFCRVGRVTHLKPRERVPHSLCFSKGAFFPLEFPRPPPNPYASNLLPR